MIECDDWIDVRDGMDDMGWYVMDGWIVVIIWLIDWWKGNISIIESILLVDHSRDVRMDWMDG